MLHHLLRFGGKVTPLVPPLLSCADGCHSALEALLGLIVRELLGVDFELGPLLGWVGAMEAKLMSDELDKVVDGR